MPGIDSKVVFGSHLDGADGAVTAEDFSIAQAAKTITFHGSAALDTAQFKWGTASALFGGVSTSYISVPDSDDFFFDANPFTVDLQVRYNVVGSNNFYSQFVDNNNRVAFRRTGGGTLQFFIISGGSTLANYTVAWTPSAGTWYHLQVVRDGTNVYIFVDGVSQTLNVLTAISTNAVPNLAAAATFASADGGTTGLDGWLDEIRVSKGIARNVATFTPPSGPYSVGGGSRMTLMGVG